MNERIKELMIKAIYDVDRIYDPIDNPLNEEVSKMYIPDCFAEKFAELIVKECARVAMTTNLEDVEGGDSDVLYASHTQIKEHFGVKE